MNAKHVTEVELLHCARTLRKFRKEKGYTQQQMADYLQISRATYTYYETAVTLPTLYAMNKMLKLWNVTWKAFFDNRDYQYTVPIRKKSDAEVLPLQITSVS